MSRPARPIAERFLEKIDTSGGPDSCHPWTAARFDSGYGAFQVRKGVLRRANRFMWELLKGPIPEGLDVLHTCDHPICCNLKHLWLGTHKENMDDMMAKGRQHFPSGDEHYLKQNPEKVRRGAATTWIKFTTEEADKIRAEYMAGNLSMKAMGKKYGCSADTICYIVNNPDYGKPDGQRFRSPGKRQFGYKLTATEVLEFKKRCAVGEDPKAVGKELGISRSMAQLIHRGKSWAHVTLPEQCSTCA